MNENTGIGIGKNLQGMNVGGGGMLKQFAQKGVMSRTVTFLVVKKGKNQAIPAKVKIYGPAGRLVVLAEGDVWTQVGEKQFVPTQFRIPMGAVRWYEVNIDGLGTVVREKISVTGDMEIPIEVE